ncbi:hypothetical protein [Henriciella litoralis]|uniref:hypothetical protein n=1 Tax=Henriciella litoralis TaxID=568102 RepID=UPI0009FDE3AC|nr:hypothetical protein [Henriciella litoralis]
MTPLSHALARQLTAHLEAASAPQIVFVSGAQGIGKSTALRGALSQLGARAIGLGLDDFYLPKAERLALAREVHPLFETRGPPGTYDLTLLMQTLTALKTAAPGDRIALPRFSKAADDRLPPDDWETWTGRPDLIVLEGWLMGLEADPSSPESPPLNAIEARDESGDWRAYQEAQLAGPYARLWDMADAFIHIDAPSFDAVLGWRLQQEEGNLGKAPGTLTPAEIAWVKTFILHYQRLTERLLSGHRRPGKSLRVDRARNLL